ncbi:MAG: transcription elongation factor GreA, partial [Clostridia bacterium]|nr:transcription elongation factor GreA [Clostridia bacterium]
MASNNVPENDQLIMSLEAITKLEEELEELRTVKRQEVSARIAQARAFGDISENSEYDEAKNEQAFIEGRILTLENMLRVVKVLDEGELDTETVSVGSTVDVHNVERNMDATYVMVSSTEADPLKGRISNESPIGRALIGQHLGSTVSVTVPAGVMHLQIT